MLFPAAGTDPNLVVHLARPTRRLMAFVDGENLVIRYQAMLKQGFVPRPEMYHEKDVAVWFRGFTHLARNHEILRVTYYTYLVGDQERWDKVSKALRALHFSRHMASLLPDTVTPCVLKKAKQGNKTKGVDVRMCVDVLSQVYRRNVDAILLMSGDSDFEPLVDEVQRNGVQVFVSAFSSGFSPRLRLKADAVYELDGTTWAPRPEKAPSA